MKKTWWDSEISDHKNYGGSVNYAGKKFVAHLLGEKCDSILDVGCGNGLVYKALDEMGKLPGIPHTMIYNYKGIDSSYKFIEACKELYPSAVWEVGDANSLEETDESYDVVLLFHIFESMNSYEDAIKEALRVAKQRVIIVFWTALSDKENDNVSTLEPNGYMTVYSAQKFFDFLKTVGYLYAPWLEFYVDEHRYNLYFILDKRYKRVESGVLPV